MSFRAKVLNIGEKIFTFIVIVAFIGGLISGVSTGMMLGGVSGIVSAIVQVFLSWSGTIVVALIVYSLLDIRHSLDKQH